MTFSGALYKSLNIKQEEERKFTLLFFHSFFLGLFVALYFVTANTLFIQYFGISKLPLAYIASGLLGYVLSLAYSQVQMRVGAKKLFVSATALMIAIPVFFFILQAFLPIKWLSFFIFIWAWPFISLVATVSGGLAIQKLDLRQVKRLFSLINTGGVSASILGYLAIPLLGFLQVPIHFYLPLASVGAIVGIVILLKIYQIFPEKQQNKIQRKEQGEQFKIRKLLSDKYYVYIFVGALVSMTSIYLVDFGFLASVKNQPTLLPDTHAVSQFLALVFGGLKVGELISSLYSGRMLSRFGIKFGLALLPTSIFGLMLLASISGQTWGRQSLALFLLIVLSKTFERIIRRSLDDPAFNVLYQPLPEEQQLSIQTRVGVVVQLATAIAGVILWILAFLLNSAEGLKIEIFPLAIMPVLGLWMYASLQLYKQYRLKLRQVLIEKSKESTKSTFRFKYGDEILRRKLKPFDKRRSRLATVILAEANPRQLLRYGIPLLREDDPIVTPTVLKSVSFFFPPKIAVEIAKVATSTTTSNWQHHVEWAKIHYKIGEPAINSEELAELSKFLQLYNSPQRSASLDEFEPFIDSNYMRIRRLAIEVIATSTNLSLRKRIVALLADAELRSHVADVLTENNQELLPELSNLFKSTKEKALLLKIIEILSKIGTNQARIILLEHINYPERDVQIAAIKGLYFCRFEADETNRDLVIRKLERIIANILWISVCMKEFEDILNTLKLQQSLELDKTDNYELLFNILSFLHTPSTVELVKKNIIGENVIFALEIIENFMSTEVKSLIIPLFENIPLSQKIKRYESIIKINKIKFNERLTEIICCDYDIIDDWTRAKAIELLGRIQKRKKSTENDTIGHDQNTLELKIWTTDAVKKVLGKIEKSEMPDEIFAAMYHPNELVYSTAARIIYDENPNRCLTYIKTLSPEKQFIKQLLETTDNREFLTITDRLKFIKRHLLFFNIPEKLLIKIASVLHPRELKKDNQIDLHSEEYQGKVILVMEGILSTIGAESERKFQKNDIILIDINLPIHQRYLVAKKNVFFFWADKSKYFNMLFDDSEILYYIFDDF